MPKNREDQYQLAQDGYDSEYESDGGTKYHNPKKIVLGQGASGRARLFKKGKKKRVIVDPVDPASIDFGEAQAKESFFKTLYPDLDVKLIKKAGTYRLVLPFIPGKMYNHLEELNKNQQIHLFLSAIESLIDCHSKGYVVLDLKEDNIFFDAESGKSYLIDGGMAAKIGENLNQFFCLSNEEGVTVARETFFHYAPECFSTSTVKAQTRMDVYSLGSMMKRLFGEIHLGSWINECCDQEPDKRPTLEALRESLLENLEELKKQKELEELEKQKELEELEKQKELEALEKQKELEALEKQKELAEKIYQEVSEIIGEVAENLFPVDIKKIHDNSSIQQAIKQFRAGCNNFKFIEPAKIEALKTYEQDVIKLISKGKDEFSNSYEDILEKAVKIIDDNGFKKFARAMGNFLATVLAAASIGGIIAMAATSKKRGGFLLFHGVERDLKKQALILNEEHEKAPAPTIS